ncbi:MAG: hypothetical protein JWN14_5047 [Chthonomonadales bacterium]|nr:hypothetical protein [Chthonomonadales bacterium]
MADNTNHFGKNHEQSLDKVTTIPTVTQALVAQYVPVLKKGQKYVSPEGRHSQQTHRRAEVRATASGHTTEKEQHAHDRNAVETEINRKANQKANQRAQNARGAAPKA